MNLFWHKLDSGLRHLIPALVSFLMALLTVIAWPVPWLGTIMPPLSLIALYYWTCHRPDLFPIGVAFALGLLTDSLSGLPIGVSAFLFTLAHFVILRQRRFFAGHSFIVLWLGFALTTFILTLMQYLILFVLRGEATPLFPLFFQTILGALFFPLPCWIFIRLQRTALGAE